MASNSTALRCYRDRTITSGTLKPRPIYEEWGLWNLISGDVTQPLAPYWLGGDPVAESHQGEVATAPVSPEVLQRPPIGRLLGGASDPGPHRKLRPVQHLSQLPRQLPVHIDTEITSARAARPFHGLRCIWNRDGFSLIHRHRPTGSSSSFSFSPFLFGPIYFPLQHLTSPFVCFLVHWNAVVGRAPSGLVGDVWPGLPWGRDVVSGLDGVHPSRTWVFYIQTCTGRAASTLVMIVARSRGVCHMAIYRFQ